MYWAYFGDFSNVLDFFNIFSYILFAIAYFATSEGGQLPDYFFYGEYLLTFSLFFGNMRGIMTFLNLFKETRFITQMLLEISLRSKPFLLVYLLVNCFSALIFVRLE